MSKKHRRVGIYWFPDQSLEQLLLSTWKGELDNHEACAMVARNCGDCLVWGVHATLLDAVAILEDDLDEFSAAMREVLQEYIPITLSNIRVPADPWPAPAD